MNRKYRSFVLGSIHETAKGLGATGIMSKVAMREFDELCLMPVRRTGADRTRGRRHASRAAEDRLWRD
jgi:putative transcriptional regulator